jgi:hypothetical protein
MALLHQKAWRLFSVRSLFQNGQSCEQRKSIAENEHRIMGFEIALKV